MILFMVYAAVLATLLALAASRVESALRGRGLPTRWVWLTSLAASLGMGAWALLRPAPAPTGGVGWGAWTDVPMTYLTELRSVVVPEPSLLERADTVVLTLWLVASLALAVALAGGLFRLARRARAWTPAHVAGGLVLLSDDFGPAVLGVRRPRVVLPRWALGLAPEQLRLVVLHEEEHRRAGDVAALVAGSVAAVLAPWNPAIWWQVRRLRAAVELDCDARVLRRGAPAELYGRLLLEMGTREPGLSLPVAALARPKSLLERRLTMIVRGGSRGGMAGVAGSLAVAAVLLVAACETPMPTSVRPPEDAVLHEASGEVAAGVITAREQKLQVMVEGLHTEGAAPLYMVNGEEVSDISHVSPDNIARVEVVKGGAAEKVFGPRGASGVVYVFTKDAPESMLREVKEMHFTPESDRPAAGSATFTPDGVSKLRASGIRGAEVFVDGEPFEGDIESIDTDTIERMEVVKGTDAKRPAAIYITLKKKGAGL